MTGKTILSRTMTEAQFDNGYWYAQELRAFAVKEGVTAAARLRKDELERAIKQLIGAGEAPASVRPPPRGAGPTDLDKGLSLDLPVVNYTSNKATKAFIQREAETIEPGFKRAPGTRYPLNRWREERLAAGDPITYRDLVLKAMELNTSKQGPLRAPQGRFNNFISDFAAADPQAPRAEVMRAWAELKAMDAPKTYAAWAAARKQP